MQEAPQKNWIVGITGASGMPYALTLIDHLEQCCDEVHVVFSEAAFRVLHEEQNVKLKSSRLSAETLIGRPSDQIFFYDNKDIGAAIASGSFLTEGMVIVPCSMGTLGAVANGLCQNLIHRAADVVLKEGRRLVIVPRETPLSSLHLENMLRLSKMQTRIVPAMPGFYQRPECIQDLVDMMVMKILDQMGLHRELVPRWGRDKGDDKDSGGRRTLSSVKSLNLVSLPSTHD